MMSSFVFAFVVVGWSSLGSLLIFLLGVILGLEVEFAVCCSGK